MSFARFNPLFNLCKQCLHKCFCDWIWRFAKYINKVQMRNAAPHSGGMESVLLWRERVSWPRNSFWSVWRRRVGVALKGSDISWDSLLKLQMQARWGYSQA